MGTEGTLGTWVEDAVDECLRWAASRWEGRCEGAGSADGGIRLFRGHPLIDYGMFKIFEKQLRVGKSRKGLGQGPNPCCRKAQSHRPNLAAPAVGTEGLWRTSNSSCLDRNQHSTPVSFVFAVFSSGDFLSFGLTRSWAASLHHSKRHENRIIAPRRCRLDRADEDRSSCPTLTPTRTRRAATKLRMVERA